MTALLPKNVRDWTKTIVDIKAGVRLAYGLQPGTSGIGSNPGYYPYTPLSYAEKVCELFAEGLAPALLSMDREFASEFVAIKVMAARVRGEAWPLDELIDYAEAYVESRRTVWGTDPLGYAENAQAEVGTLYRIAKAATSALNVYEIASKGALVGGPVNGAFFLAPLDNVRFWDAWTRVAIEYDVAGAQISYPTFWDAVRNESKELGRDVGEAARAAAELTADVAKATARLAGEVVGEAALGFGLLPLAAIGLGIYAGGKYL